MFCRSCRYSLTGLPDGACPECGTLFIAADPATWVSTTRPPRRVRWLERAALVAAALLPLWVASVYLNALIACLVLGRWPVPSIDDPRDIDGLAPLYVLTVLLMVAGNVAVLGWLLAMVAAAAVRAWGSVLRIGGFGAALTCAAALLIRLDLGRVMEWIFD